MKIFHRRYLALYCCLFIFSSLIACLIVGRIQFFLSLGILGSCLVALLSLIFCKRHRAWLLHLALCLLFSGGAFLHNYIAVDRPQGQLAPIFGTELHTELCIRDVNYCSTYSSSFDVSFVYHEKTYSAMLFCDYPADYTEGDILFGAVLAEPIEEYVQNYRYHFAMGQYVHLSAENDDLEVAGRAASDLATHLERINREFSDILTDTVGGDEASLISAMLLGDRSSLGKDIQRNFQRVGVTHILSISGLHLSIIMMVLEGLLCRLHVKKGARCLVVFAFALFYLALTGFSLPTVRAFIMMSLIYLAYYLSAENDAVTSLFFAVFLIFLFSPTSVWDLGIWLSFLAMLGILMGNHLMTYLTEKLYQSRLRRVARPLAALASAIAVTIAANVFVSLPAWIFFGEFSLVTLPVNLIISPLISPLMILGALLIPAVLCQLPSLLVTGLSFAASWLSRMILDIVSLFSKMEDIVVSLRYPFAGIIAILTSGLLCFLLMVKTKRKILILLIPTAAAVLFFGCLAGYQALHRDQLTIDYLTGTESEMLVLTTEQDAVICDLSSGAYQFLADAIEQAKARYATEITALVLTHYHTLHNGTIFEHGASSTIRRLYLPYPTDQNEYYRMISLIDIAQKSEIAVEIYDREFPFSPAENICLTLSYAEYLSRSTHPTFFLTVSAFDKSLMYMAESAHDSPSLYQKIKHKIPSSQYLLFGAHGPITKHDLIYPELSPLHYIAVCDPTVLAAFDPGNAQHIITDANLVSFRLEK